MKEKSEIVRATDVRTLIEDAFSRTIAPEDIFISNYPRADKDPEMIEMRKAFRGKRWKDIPEDICWAYGYQAAFFSDEAYAYYLPAYMAASLIAFIGGRVSDFEGFTNITLDDLLSGGRFANALRTRLKAYRGSQWRALRSFVIFFKESSNSFYGPTAASVIFAIDSILHENFGGNNFPS